MKKRLFITFCVVLSVALIFFIPLMINWLFSQSAPCELLEAKWIEADALNYGGAVLSFIGTIVLGAIAVFQTRKAYEQTERANQLAEDALVQTEKANKLADQMQKLEQARFVSMVSVKKLWIKKQSFKNPRYVNLEARDLEYIDLTAKGFVCTHCYHIDVMFENHSDYPIVQLVTHVGEWNSAAYQLAGMENRESPIYISDHGEQAVRFIVPSMLFEEMGHFGVSLRMGFVNVFDYVTPATIHIPDLENSGDRNEYKFRLAKFTDIRPSEEQESE